MDILYYSNYCKHSQKIIQYLVKNNLSNEINFICLDKRKIDDKTKQLLVVLENGKLATVPPNITCVPSLLLINQKYRVISGDEIIDHYKSNVSKKQGNTERGYEEPMSYCFVPCTNGTNIVSEQYTPYDMTPEELSSKGIGGKRQMHNYVLANHSAVPNIETPPDNYTPDKINVSLDDLQKKRADEIH